MSLKDYLERDGVPADGGTLEEQRLTVDRLGRRTYVVRLTDGGTLPVLQNCEVVDRLVAQPRSAG